MLEQYQWRPARQKKKKKKLELDDEDKSDCKVTFSCSYFKILGNVRHANMAFHFDCPTLPHFLTCIQHFLSKYEYKVTLTLRDGRAIAQAVSRWLPGSGQVEFVVDKVALGQVFSEYFGFSCQSSFHQIFHPHNPQG
jgi:hypothetical protein